MQRNLTNIERSSGTAKWNAQGIWMGGFSPLHPPFRSSSFPRGPHDGTRLSNAAELERRKVETHPACGHA